ncbi:MAG: PHP domain-containing protein [Desulfatitalea sp.]|nr:PHP domain-containing protein [Desulfatitalea sp.]
MKKPLDSNFQGGIDLHLHSTASDGTCPPNALLDMASDMGLEAIAITDHDTLQGVLGALRGPIPERLHLLTGVEISTQAPEGFAVGGSLHILGYGVDVDDAPLQDALSELQAARDSRIPLIVDRLNAMGIALTMEQVLAHAGTGSPGRPHVATALIRMGIVESVDEAFDRLLSKGRPGYVDKYRIPCRRAIERIEQAGGVAVLAHPYLVPGGDHAITLAPLVRALCDMGLAGIEVYYPEHSPEAVAHYLEVARQFDLLVTGGTDFHGALTPDIQMGRGRGDLHIPLALYEALAERVSPRGRIVAGPRTQGAACAPPDL